MNKKYLTGFLLLSLLFATPICMARGGHGGGGHGGGFHGGGFHGGGWGGHHRGGFGGGGWSGHRDGYSGGGWSNHHIGGFGGGGWGFSYGIPFYWPYFPFSTFYNSSYYHPMRNPPMVYIEQGVPPKQENLETDQWNYCSNPEGYYPHIKECPVGWQKIEPQPVGQEKGYWYYCSNPSGYYPYIRDCSTPWQKIVP